MSTRRKAVFACALTVMAAAVGFILFYLGSEDRDHKVYEELQEKVAVPPIVDAPVTAPDGAAAPFDPADSDPGPGQEPDAEPVPGETDGQAAPEEPPEPEEPYVSPLDFDEIRRPNEDIYAWLDIPDTDIQYPVVQHPTDDAYYLDHTIEGKARYPGSIYTEKCNSKDFSDFLTVVYGHNMKNGTMFGELKKFRNGKYADEHPMISFYTPEGEYHYRVFAAVTYSNAYLPNAYDYDSPQGREDFIDSIRGVRDLNSYVDREAEVTADDRLVVLSTCMGNDSYRLLVVGVLDKELSTK